MATVDSTVTAEVEYRDTPGFPGYRVGSDGSVWSCWGRGHHGRQSGVWRRLIPSANPTSGHLCVGIRNGGRKQYVHRLIAIAFFGSVPEGKEVCHNNGDPADNRLDNLRFDTRRGNLADRVAHGTLNEGERQGHAKLTDESARLIRAEYASGFGSYKAIGERYGVDFSTVYAVVKRKTWRHVLP